MPRAISRIWSLRRFFSGRVTIFLNIVHFQATHVNIVQINPEICKMQTLAVDIASTFVDGRRSRDRPGRTLLRFAMAPIDRIANACDIAGVLTERRATFRMWRASRACAVTRAAGSACSAASRPFATSLISREAGAPGTFRSARMQDLAARKDLPYPDIRSRCRGL